MPRLSGPVHGSGLPEAFPCLCGASASYRFRVYPGGLIIYVVLTVLRQFRRGGGSEATFCVLPAPFPGQVVSLPLMVCSGRSTEAWEDYKVRRYLLYKLCGPNSDCALETDQRLLASVTLETRGQRIWAKLSVAF